MIYAQDIVEIVPDLMLLRTFGFSLASEVDVDGNSYNGQSSSSHAQAVTLRTVWPVLGIETVKGALSTEKCYRPIVQ